MNFEGALMAIGLIILVGVLLIVFGGVEKEDPYATSHSIKKPHSKQKE